jgi:hypothetical protein
MQAVVACMRKFLMRMNGVLKAVKRRKGALLRRKAPAPKARGA